MGDIQERRVIDRGRMQFGQCRVAGDWARNCHGVAEPTGWFFEYANPHYPDVDDTAMVVMALQRAGGKEAQAAVAAPPSRTGSRSPAWS